MIVKKLKKNTSLHIVVNNRCNNNCVFCMETNPGNMYIPDIKEAEELFMKSRKRTESILFTGPEPTLNRNLNKYFKKAKDLGFSEIRLITNGRMLAYFDYAKDLFINGLNEVSVSLHGSNPTMHDAITRTPGSFLETLKGCNNLMKLKSSHSFKSFVNFTLTRLNSKDLFDFFKLIERFKFFDGIIINLVIPHGRAKVYFSNVIGKYSQLINDFEDAISKFRVNLKTELNASLLGAPNCLLTNKKLFAIEYEDILRTSRTKLQNIKTGRRYSRIKNTNCRKCRYFYSCHGVWNEYIKRTGWTEFIPIE